MGKPRLLRAAGFLGALGATAALIGFGVSSTGAYFTDSHPGTITASAGHLKLDITNGTTTTLTFNDLVPGHYKTQTIDYQANTSTPEDIWLVFNTSTSSDLTAYCQFTGPKKGGGCTGGGLGQDGHFAVANNGNTVFQSYNLQNQGTGTNNLGYPTCSVNSNGDGGSGHPPTNPPQPICGVPQDILLATNVPNTKTGTITVTFGVTDKWTVQSVPVIGSLPYSIVATQAGVRPDAPNI